MARAFPASYPSCERPLEPGFLGTNSKLSWAQSAGRLFLEGETVGNKVIATVQNFRAWRCNARPMLQFDYGDAR
jgi:hypothetical protein